jgi:ATP-dependent helicase IRC3
MLRNYQRDTLAAITGAYKTGVRKQLISLATGAGKTVIFSNIPSALKGTLDGQMLVLAHREELITQAAEKLLHWNPAMSIGVEMADSYASTNADIIVSSVATLGRKVSKRRDRFNWDNVDKCVCDEAHHSTATTYMTVFEEAGFLRPESHKLLLGVTATPNRGDGKPLAGVYDKIVYQYSMRQAIEDGWLVDVRGIRVQTQTNLDKIHVVAGDFAQDELADSVNTDERNQLVVRAWKDSAADRQTIVFTVDIKHAVDLAGMFRAHGVNAEAIWGNDPERAEKLQRHRRGDIQLLTNCGVLTEGYDDWNIACVLLARPTKSAALFQQMVGRGTRLQDGTGNLLEAVKSGTELKKKDCLMIDVVDSCTRHSLVTLPSLLGMAARLDLNGKSAIKSLKELEDGQRQYPQIDFSKLEDINKLKAFIESVNLWEIRFPEVVEDNSTLSWHSTMNGGFSLSLPNREFVTISQNILEKWDILGLINGQGYKGERTTIEEAFQTADRLVMDKASNHLRILKREGEKWHEDGATEAQLKLLRKFYKGRAIPADLTKGAASKLIGSFFAGNKRAA